MILKSVGVMSVGKVIGTLYAFLGLIGGAILSLLAVSGVALNAQQEGGPAPGLPMLFGVGAIIILPIFYGVVGFIGGIIMGAVYNIVAGIIGGIELRLE